MPEDQYIDGYRVLRRYTVAEAEAEHVVVTGWLWWRKRTPFGFSNHHWLAMISQMADGDELWYTSAPQEEWDRNMGNSGILLVRDGKVVDSLLLSLN
ncbi:hypothetical protein Poly51_39980 [Rubripirellula tenax]|uniref:Uncharacterized protein n=1 Tax=Rubripirellula tenax TaxID=2528015 RepID=A0A5C6EQ01_9BACT|nr:hypothetical protein [Rubripirellula tenax]TWU50705.1 hypothetical protein Poly51_39980 [Rubripirellula tenax]